MIESLVELDVDSTFIYEEPAFDIECDKYPFIFLFDEYESKYNPSLYLPPLEPLTLSSQSSPSLTEADENHLLMSLFYNDYDDDDAANDDVVIPADNLVFLKNAQYRFSKGNVNVDIKGGYLQTNQNKCGCYYYIFKIPSFPYNHEYDISILYTSQSYFDSDKHTFHTYFVTGKQKSTDLVAVNFHWLDKPQLPLRFVPDKSPSSFYSDFIPIKSFGQRTIHKLRVPADKVVEDAQYIAITLRPLCGIKSKDKRFRPKHYFVVNGIRTEPFVFVSKRPPYH